MTGSVMNVIADRYRVVRRIGKGAMGEVYEVQHPTLARREAIKLLNPALSLDKDFKRRFLREADVMASLAHPNAVMVLDRGEDADGRMWLAMELVDGTDAERYLEQHGPMSQALAVEVIKGAAAALDYAWQERRVVHRDVKPANILLGMRRGKIEAVKLADFGIAKAVDGATALTGTGLTIGTLEYMAPEALEGGELDGHADQYSLGCTAYALLTGSSPYAAGSKAAVLAGHLSQPVPSITDHAPTLPKEIDSVFKRCLAKQQGDRYGSCMEFVDALENMMHTAGTMRAPGQSSAQAQQVKRCDTTHIGPAPTRANESTADRPTKGVRSWVVALALCIVLVAMGAVTLNIWPDAGQAEEGPSPETTIGETPSVSTNQFVDLLPTSSTVSNLLSLPVEDRSVSTTKPTPATLRLPAACGGISVMGLPAGFTDGRTAQYSLPNAQLRIDIARYSDSQAAASAARGVPNTCTYTTPRGGQSGELTHFISLAPVQRPVVWAVSHSYNLATADESAQWAGNSTALGVNGSYVAWAIFTPTGRPIDADARKVAAVVTDALQNAAR